MSAPLQLSGKRFGRWRVIHRAEGVNPSRTHWLCRCSCGKKRIVCGARLKFGLSKSCGCLKRDLLTIHGMSKSPEFRSWDSMLQRCTNRHAPNWKYYGGRGITVCSLWRRSFAAFYRDMGRRPFGRSLDRRNNDGDYTHSNCRWATKATQMTNKRQQGPR
jgi:hypothetical protein